MQPSPLFMGLNITPRFAEALGMAQEKQDRQQMTHTKSSTQDREYSPAGFEQNLYEKSDIYRTTKDAITAPMRAIEGTLDVNSPQGVEEALGTARMGLVGSMPGGAKGPGSLGIVREPHLSPFVENSIYPMMPGAKLKPTKWVQRNVHNDAELEDIINSGYMLPKPGGKAQKYFTATDEVNVKTTAKNILRIKRENVPENIAVKLEDVEIFNRETSSWEPLANRRNQTKEGLGETSSPVQELEAKTQDNLKKPDKTSEAPDPMLSALEKLTAMIETMNKPKTVLRDKDGKIVGVA